MCRQYILWIIEGDLVPQAVLNRLPRAVGRRELRTLMSYWPTGVSLITTTDNGQPAGCTANALTSLSLEPPMLIVCFDLGSRTFEAMRNSGRFCVNILAADQHDVSRLFATKRSHAEKFGEVSYRLDAGVPVLDGCLAFVVCEVADEAEGGDHVIVFGRPLVGGHDDAKDPLIFYKSTYWDFAEGQR